MKRRSMYHEGHRALQDRFDGRRVADALEEHRRLEKFLPENVAFIESAGFFFLATAHAGQREQQERAQHGQGRRVLHQEASKRGGYAP